jgi:hypothetical protein
MKKLLMLIAVLFGTSVMVTAGNLTSKTTPVKEVKMTKHPKHHKAKADKKMEKKATTIEASTPKAK